MSRELRPKDRAPQAPTLLTDVDRLPIDAAVDMVVTALRSGGRLLNTALSARLNELQPPRRGALAGRPMEASTCAALRAAVALELLLPICLQEKTQPFPNSTQLQTHPSSACSGQNCLRSRSDSHHR